MKRNRGKQPKTEFHKEGKKTRRNKKDASKSLALPEPLSEHRKDLLSKNLSSSRSAATKSKLEPGVAGSLSITNKELLLADLNSELTPDLVNFVSYLENELSLTDPNSELTLDLAEYAIWLENELLSADQPTSTAAGAAAAAASNSKPHPKLANSGSVVKNDPLLAGPHTFAVISSSVQLQSQQTEHQSSIRGGLFQEHLDCSELYLFPYDSTSSSEPNSYTVEATDKYIRTIWFEITHTSSLEEVRTEIARRFEMERHSFWIKNANTAERGVMRNNSDLSKAIVEATRSGSRFIRLKVYRFR